MWRSLLQAALDLIYPTRQQCPLCAGHSPDKSFCQPCRQLLASFAQETICSFCGSFIKYQTHSFKRVALCYDCRSGTRSFDLARSVGPYEGSLREAVHRLKYRGMKGLAHPLGLLMAETALREPAYSCTQILVPVPLYPRREKQRGFNQALLLARELEEPLQATVWERVLVKMRETPPQTGLSRPEREKNLLNSFAVTQPEIVRGKVVTIVDDVFTTGTTVTILSQILRQAGAAKVLVITLTGARQNGKN